MMKKICLTLNLLNILLLANSRASTPVSTNFDTSSQLLDLDTTILGFGSCSNSFYSLGEDVWSSLTSNIKPELFLWTGDAVYTSSEERSVYGSLGALQRAYENLTSPNSPYSHFLADTRVKVEGTWDDHDLGVNDGGKYASNKQERQNLFLDFLGLSPNDVRRERNGVYSAHWYSVNVPLDASKSSTRAQKTGHIAVILLDTRSHRDNHYIPSLGGISWLPFASVISAFCRLFTQGLDHDGDMLGEQQWTWLEQVLKEAKEKADVTLVVSSVQVLTSNPLVESWGHFPRSKVVQSKPSVITCSMSVK